MLRQFLSLFRVIAGSAGRTAFQRAAPLYFAILLAAAVIFSPKGMRAADVMEISARSLAFRLCLFGLWLMAATPAARAVLCEPALFFLRSLPVPRWHFFVGQGLLLFLVELPWSMLFCRGAGSVMGLCAAVTAMAAHALIVARPWKLLEWGAAAGLLSMMVLTPPSAPLLGVAGAALAIGMGAAWVAAPARDAGAGRPLGLIRGPAVLALTGAYLLTLWRSHGALLWRGFLLALLATSITTLALKNNDIRDAELRSTVSLGILFGPLLLGACGLSGPVLRSERQARWLLDACGLSGGIRVLTASLAVALWGMFFAGLHGLLVGWLLEASSADELRLCFGAILTGASLGVVASSCVRWAHRGDKKDGDRVLLAMLLCLVGGAVTTWLLHEAVLGLFGISALAMAGRAATSALPSGRWLRLRHERQQGDLL